MSASNDDQPGSANRQPIRDGIDNARHQVGDAAASAATAARASVDRARDGLGQARERAADAYAAGRERAGDAVAHARDTAAEARGRAADTFEANPLVALAGGVGLGLLIGALLPRTDRETALYGAVGARLTDAAREAAGAAKDAGRDKISDMGFNRDNARDAARGILDAALAALTSAGGAAARAAKDSADDAVSRGG